MRDFDQLLDALRFIIEIATNQTTADTLEQFAVFVSVEEDRDALPVQIALCTGVVIGSETSTPPCNHPSDDHSPRTERTDPIGFTETRDVA